MSRYYILYGHKAVPAQLMEWARWFETAGHSRVVAKTPVGECTVSTVFLGSDHQCGSGPPLIFETLVFGGAFDGEVVRYSTWAEAERGHADMLAKVSA